MNILMLCTKYPESIDDSYLTSDLADAMAALGNAVTVVALQWEARNRILEPKIIFPSGVTVHYFQTKNIAMFGLIVERLSRWGLSAIRVRKDVENILSKQQYDLVVVFGPLTPMGTIVYKQLRRATKSIAYISDFFPFAQRDLGIVPRGLIFKIAFEIENYLLQKFDFVACMSAKNVDFLRSHYQLPAKLHVIVRRLWGSIGTPTRLDEGAVRKRYGLPCNRRIVLFGGQLTEGRGVEEIIHAAEIMSDDPLSPVILIVGSGRLFPLVQDALERQVSALNYLPPMPRDQYLELASACDCGLIVTVAHTNVPTFPSKVIDYTRCGLPVLASVEASTDFSEFIESKGFGKSILAGDAKNLAETIGRFFTNEAKLNYMKKMSLLTSKNDFSVEKAAIDILNTIA